MLASSSYPVEQHLETVCITIKVFFVVEKRPDPTTGTPHPGWTAHPLINVCIDRRSWTIYRQERITPFVPELDAIRKLQSQKRSKKNLNSLEICSYGKRRTQNKHCIFIRLTTWMKNLRSVESYSIINCKCRKYGKGEQMN